jgi:hypothetical protein
VVILVGKQGGKAGFWDARPPKKEKCYKKKEGRVMSKKANNAAPKAATINPALDAPNPEVEAIQAEPAPDLEKPSEDFRAELVAKAQAARQAAKVGLIPQEQADALWAQAVDACKPTEESLVLAKAAKTKKDDAEKVLKAAQAALKAELLTEEVVKEKQAIADAAKAAYTEAAKAAKGFSLGAGSGGGLRFKGQMSGLDAAFRILSESEKPLNPGAIAKAAIEQGLWAPEGQTPSSTMSAALQADTKKGDQARFVKVGAGLYTVRNANAE